MQIVHYVVVCVYYQWIVNLNFYSHGFFFDNLTMFTYNCSMRPWVHHIKLCSNSQMTLCECVFNHRVVQLACKLLILSKCNSFRLFACWLTIQSFEPMICNLWNHVIIATISSLIILIFFHSEDVIYDKIIFYKIQTVSNSFFQDESYFLCKLPI